MRRLRDNARQRAEAEQELRNLISQVHGHKREAEEHNNLRQRTGKVGNPSDLKKREV